MSTKKELIGDVQSLGRAVDRGNAEVKELRTALKHVIELTPSLRDRYRWDVEGFISDVNRRYEKLQEEQLDKEIQENLKELEAL